MTESWNRTRRALTWLLEPGREPRLLFDRLSEDRYGDPGRFLTVATAGGTRVLQTSGNGQSAYLTGAGASPLGDRPFLDQFDFATGQSRRLWQSEAPYYESVVALLDPARRTVLTQRESANDPPNYFVRTLGKTDLQQLTRFPIRPRSSQA